MKNRFYILTATALSLLCFSCTKTQVAHSENEKTITPPIMGWSSWNAFRVDISEDIIKHQADLMVEKGLKDAGYHYINVDDGFFGKRDDNGIMFTNEKRFPNGMKPVADHIHSLGMKAGIYTEHLWFYLGQRPCRSRRRYLWARTSRRPAILWRLGLRLYQNRLLWRRCPRTGRGRTLYFYPQQH